MSDWQSNQWANNQQQQQLYQQGGNAAQQQYQPQGYGMTSQFQAPPPPPGPGQYQGAFSGQQVGWNQNQFQQSNSIQGQQNQYYQQPQQTQGMYQQQQQQQQQQYQAAGSSLSYQLPNGQGAAWNSNSHTMAMNAQTPGYIPPPPPRPNSSQSSMGTVVQQQGMSQLQGLGVMSQQVAPQQVLGAMPQQGFIPPPPPPKQNPSLPNQTSHYGPSHGQGSASARVQNQLSHYGPTRSRDPKPAASTVSTQKTSSRHGQSVKFNNPNYCKLCDVCCPNEHSFQQHMVGARHRKNAQKLTAKITSKNKDESPVKVADGSGSQTLHFCAVCNVTCPNEFSYEQHINGALHRKRAGLGDQPSGSSGGLPPPPAAQKSSSTASSGDGKDEVRKFCEICNLMCPNEYSYQQHINGKKHQKKAALEMVFRGAGAEDVCTPTAPLSAPLSDGEDSKESPKESQALVPVASSEVKDDEKKTVDSDVEEEGEIDEEKEDINKLYDEFATPPKPDEPPEEDKETDSNATDKKDGASENETVTVAGPKSILRSSLKSTDATSATQVDSSKQAATILDSGMGFVLDYGPDEAAARSISQPSPQDDENVEGDDDEDDMFGSDDDESTSEPPAKLQKKSALKKAPVLNGAPLNIMPPTPEKAATHYPPLHPDKYWHELRTWDFVKALTDAIRKAPPARDESGTKRGRDEEVSRMETALPDSFDSAEQYKALWSLLLIREAKAQILNEVVTAQSSPTTAWVQGNDIVVGLQAKVEPSRSARDSSSNSTSTDATVVLRLEPTVKGAGFECAVSPDDLLLFVPQPAIVERALRGATIQTSELVGVLPKGQLGFVAQAINHRNRSADGLLARASQKHWNRFSSLNDMFVLRIGSNVTGLREFNALCKVDELPLLKYVLDGRVSSDEGVTTTSQDLSSEQTADAPTAAAKFDPLAQNSGLPVGFRIAIKSRMNESQLNAITAAASEYGSGGFTLVKGPPGTGKSTTLVSILNAIHLRQYQEYYSAIEKIVTESTVSAHYEELAALNRAADVKPRILVAAPSNAGIDNVVLKLMSTRFVDGRGTQYSPSIVRVGVGSTSSRVKSVSLKEMVDGMVKQGSDMSKLDSIISTGRKNLKRHQQEINKIRERIHAMLDCCPYEISSDWEVRIDEASFQASGRVVFVNHRTKTTTFDLPPKFRPNERPAKIKTMPHYISLLKSFTKLVEKHNNETSTLEKYIILQNEAKARLDGDGHKGEDNNSPDSLTSQLETHLLNSTHIVLTTLGSSGSRAMEAANKFKVVVVDEAAQSSEVSSLVALQHGSSHAIMVGDPQQLPATIFSVSGKTTKYDRSLFQRLEENGHDVHLLDTQYRMDPIISNFPRRIFYKGLLKDGPKVQEADFGGPLKLAIQFKFPHFRPLTILDLDSTEDRAGTSLTNKREAELALQLYRTIDRETDGLLAKSRVAVITPYSQQCSLLKRMFEQNYGSSYPTRVHVSTIDAFQGNEAGVVIYSCVRASGSKGIGFLGDVQRMNVALTRAKHYLFVIARRRSIMVNPYWRELVGYARSQKALIEVPCVKRHDYPKRSSLLKNHNAKKVSFGATSEQTFEVGSQVQPTITQTEDTFPSLVELKPVHASDNKDGYCSA